MYLEHFEIREMPFTLTPNTQYYCNLSTYEETLKVLLFNLHHGEGFIKVIGEVGAGKTLLCRKLLAELHDEYVTAYIPNPDLTPNGLRKAIASELGVSLLKEADQTDVMEALTKRLLTLHSAGKRIVLIIDEAQALTDASLETVRLLTNIETESEKLLQIVLFAQPELDQRLNQYKFRQLKQRISFSYELGDLKYDDIQAYIGHRLSIAGYDKGNLFSKRARKALFKKSHGIPRLVNVLCHKSMLVAYGNGEKIIGRQAVLRAASDTESTTKKKRISLSNSVFYFGLLAILIGLGFYMAMSIGWL